MIRKIVGVLWVAGLLLFSNLLDAKTVLAPTSHMRVVGHISGKVEIILQSLAFTEEQKKEMLTVEHRNMLALGLDTTEPALFAKIEAYLGLSSVRLHRLQKTAEAKSEAAGVKNTVAKKEENLAEKKSGFLAYAQQVITDAKVFSDVQDVPGMPCVSDLREMTAGEREQEAQTNPAVAAVCADAQVVHEKITFFVKKSTKIQSFIAAFESHIRVRYQENRAGLQEEVLYRVFEALAYPEIESDLLLRDKIGEFLETYNSYVGADEQVLPDELAIPFAQWGATIKTSSDAEKHIMLLLSWAMDSVKASVKHDPFFAQKTEALQERTAQAAQALSALGVEMESARSTEPLYIAMQCSEHVEKLLQAEELTEEARAHAEKLTLFAEQLSGLMNEYDVLTRQQADSASVQRAQEDVHSLPVEQQEVLMQELQSQMLEGVMPPEVALLLGQQAPQKKSSKKEIAIGAAVGGAVVLGALEVAGRVSSQKTGTFFEMFNKVGTPSGWATGTYQRIFGNNKRGDDAHELPGSASVESKNTEKEDIEDRGAEQQRGL